MPFGRGRRAARVLARTIDVAAWCACRLPTRLAHGLAGIGGHLEWAARPRLRTRLATNLAHAVGAPARSRSVRRLVRRQLVNEARRSADLLWAIGRPDDFLAATAFVGREHALTALGRGRGVILAGLHVGGWELAAPLPRHRLASPATVVVADNWLAWAMEHVRERAGLRTIPRHHSALHALRALRRNEILLVLGDDAWGARPRRYPVPFGDAVAHLPAGVVALARISGAPIVPFDVLPDAPRRWRATLHPAIAPPAPDGGDEAEQAVLAELAARWTATIRAHPDHWAARFPIEWVP